MLNVFGFVTRPTDEPRDGLISFGVDRHLWLVPVDCFGGMVLVEPVEWEVDLLVVLDQ